MFDLIDLDSLTNIFYFERKQDLARYCKEATIHSSDFASFILACEAGALPWQHRIFFRDIVPNHLRNTEDELMAIATNGVGPLQGKAKKAVTKMYQLFQERRYLVGHIFFNHNLSDWHFFYFDQRDISQRNNHWEHGPHIHLINKLWPGQDANSLWSSFTSGNFKLAGSMHIRYSERRRVGA